MDVGKNPSFTAGIDSSLQQIALIASGLEYAKNTNAFKSDSSYFSAVGSLMAGLMSEVANEGLEFVNAGKQSIVKVNVDGSPELAIVKVKLD